MCYVSVVLEIYFALVLYGDTIVLQLFKRICNKADTTMIYVGYHLYVYLVASACTSLSLTHHKQELPPIRM